MSRDYSLRCPVCGTVVRQSHQCHGHIEPPLEGEDAVNAARDVLRVLHAQRYPSGAPREPIQGRLTFGGEGL